jgi:DNA-binding protein HU-beta
MNKAELIDEVAAKTGMTKKEADKAVNAFIEAVSEALVKGDRVQLVGFGAFEVRERAERKGNNPRTGDATVIAASRTPAFRAGKNLKSLVK